MLRPEDSVELFPALNVHEIEERALNGGSLFSSISDEHHSKSTN